MSGIDSSMQIVGFLGPFGTLVHALFL